MVNVWLGPAEGLYFAHVTHAPFHFSPPHLSAAEAFMRADEGDVDSRRRGAAEDAPVAPAVASAAIEDGEDSNADSSMAAGGTQG